MVCRRMVEESYLAVCIDGADATENWANNEYYQVGDRVIDPDLATSWICLVINLSAAAGTFADDRAGAAAGCWRAFTAIDPDGNHTGGPCTNVNGSGNKKGFPS